MLMQLLVQGIVECRKIPCVIISKSDTKWLCVPPAKPQHILSGSCYLTFELNISIFNSRSPKKKDFSSIVVPPVEKKKRQRVKEPFALLDGVQ